MEWERSLYMGCRTRSALWNISSFLCSFSGLGYLLVSILNFWAVDIFQLALSAHTHIWIFWSLYLCAILAEFWEVLLLCCFIVISFDALFLAWFSGSWFLTCLAGQKNNRMLLPRAIVYYEVCCLLDYTRHFFYWLPQKKLSSSPANTTISCYMLDLPSCFWCFLTSFSEEVHWKSKTTTWTRD